MAKGVGATPATFYGVLDGYGPWNTTASGEPFDPYAMTAAHPYLPFGTVLTVCLDGCVEVVVNDRCACSLDLTYGAAQKIGLDGAGDVEVY